MRSKRTSDEKFTRDSKELPPPSKATPPSCRNTRFRKAEGNQKHASVDSANHLESDEAQQRSDLMDPIIFTPRLKLTLVTKAERGSPELEWIHELRSNEKTTWWR